MGEESMHYLKLHSLQEAKNCLMHSRSIRKNKRLYLIYNEYKVLVINLYTVYLRKSTSNSVTFYGYYYSLFYINIYI